MYSRRQQSTAPGPQESTTRQQGTRRMRVCPTAPHIPAPNAAPETCQACSCCACVGGGGVLLRWTLNCVKKACGVCRAHADETAPHNIRLLRTRRASRVTI